MPIIKSNCKEKDIFEANIDSKIFREILDYCSWADIDDVGVFIEEAAKLLLTNKIKISSNNKINSNNLSALRTWIKNYKS